MLALRRWCAAARQAVRALTRADWGHPFLAYLPAAGPPDASRRVGASDDLRRRGRAAVAAGLRRPVNHHHEWVKTSTNRRLCGVAAKYLDDCLAWMRMRVWFEDGTEPEHSTVAGLGQQTINR